MSYDLGIVVYRSGQVTKALTANSVAQSWTSLVATGTRPLSDGVFNATLLADSAGVGSSWEMVKLYPVCEGIGTFSVRVWGWEVLRFAAGTPVTPGLNRIETWFPTLLGEFVCQTSATALTGPIPASRGLVGAGQQGMMLDTESFAEQIDLAQGTFNTITSYGVGMGFPAQVFVDLAQCQLVQFDFSQDNETPIGMNCWWSFA